MLNWLLTLEEAVMLQTVSRLLPELLVFIMTAVATHLVMSFAQHVGYGWPRRPTVHRSTASAARRVPAVRQADRAPQAPGDAPDSSSSPLLPCHAAAPAGFSGTWSRGSAGRRASYRRPSTSALRRSSTR